MKRGWTRRDGVSLIVAAVALFIADGCFALYARTTGPGAQAIVSLGVVISVAMFLFGLYVLTGRLAPKSN